MTSHLRLYAPLSRTGRSRISEPSETFSSPRRATIPIEKLRIRRARESGSVVSSSLELFEYEFFSIKHLVIDLRFVESDYFPILARIIFGCEASPSNISYCFENV
jgi:hypothetical protein